MSTSEKQKRDRLALSYVFGLGQQGLDHIAKAGYSATDLLQQPALATELGLAPAIVKQLRQPNWSQVDADLAWAAQDGHEILFYADQDYPVLLKQTASPPALLYMQGDRRILSLPRFAIVGSRNPTASGKDTAYQFAKHLAKQGLCIASGLALGIDAAAHQGALAGDGFTIAVLGSGLQNIYPARNKKLAEQISAMGIVMSEFPLNTPPKAENFPRRNRIISGLSLGCLVVEAAIRSGSLISARYAGEQGREVFAIPGSIHNPLARGCHHLIRQGAKLVETADDILDELKHLYQASSVAEPHQQSLPTEPADELDDVYQQLLTTIGYEATPIDLMITRSAFTSDEIASMLVILELNGHIESVPGGYSRRK